MLTLLNYLYYATWVFVFATLFYEAAVRTNMRRLMKYGMPICWQKHQLGQPTDLLDQLAHLTDSLNAETAVATGWQTMQKMLRPGNNNRPQFLLLPTAQNEIEYRQGTSCRGRIILNEAQAELRIIGFYTWPSLAVPLLIFLVSSFLPLGFLLIYLLLIGNIYMQRQQAQFVAVIINHEFTNKHLIDSSL